MLSDWLLSVQPTLIKVSGGDMFKVGDVVELCPSQLHWADARYWQAMTVVKWRGSSKDATISLSIVNHKPKAFFKPQAPSKVISALTTQLGDSNEK